MAEVKEKGGAIVFFSPAGELSFLSKKISVQNTPLRMKISGDRNLTVKFKTFFWKFAVVCQNIATFCLIRSTFLTHDAAD